MSLDLPSTDWGTPGRTSGCWWTVFHSGTCKGHCWRRTRFSKGWGWHCLSIKDQPSFCGKAPTGGVRRPWRTPAFQAPAVESASRQAGISCPSGPHNTCPEGTLRKGNLVGTQAFWLLGFRCTTTDSILIPQTACFYGLADLTLWHNKFNQKAGKMSTTCLKFGCSLLDQI